MKITCDADFLEFFDWAMFPKLSFGVSLFLALLSLLFASLLKLMEVKGNFGLESQVDGESSSGMNPSKKKLSMEILSRVGLR